MRGSSGGVERQRSIRKQISTYSDDGTGTKKDLKRQVSEKQQEEWDKELPVAPLSRIIAVNAKEWWLIILGVIGAAVNGLIFPSFSIFFGEILRIFGLPPDQVLGETHMWGALFVALGFVSGIANFLKVLIDG